MKGKTTFFQSFKLLFQHKPRKLITVFMLTLFQGISSGLSIVMLIPLLQLLSNNNVGNSDKIAALLNTLAEKTGITMNLESILLIYVVLLSLIALLNYWNSLINLEYQQTFIHNLRQRLFRKIVMADWHLLGKKSKTNHLQVLTSEVPNLADFYFFLIRLLINIIMTISYISFAFLISVKFTLLITGFGLLLFVLLRKYLYKSFELGEAQIKNYNRLLKYIDDFWQTIKIAKVHSSEKFYYDKFDDASSSLFNLEYQIEKNYSLPNLIYRLCGIIVLVLIVYLGYRFDQVPLTSFFILIILFARIYPQFSGINTNVNMILSNLPSVKLVIKLDSDFTEPAIFESAPKGRLVLEKEITINNINFAYPGGKILFNGINANIPALKITGILGESGIGKTTFIDLIAGLQKPSHGEIRIDGKLLNEQLSPAWKSSIGYLPQDAFFIDGTIRENLVWDSSEKLSNKEIWDILKQVNGAHLVKRFKRELDEPISSYQHHFSRGERQRLALARVLLRHPNLLLLDEATSSLDDENEKIIMEVLFRLKNEITIIFVTHRTSVISWFDHIIRI